MPQRKKAKTKRDMKKSINSLWKALQKEKHRHELATKHVDRLRHTLQLQGNVMMRFAETEQEMGHEIICLQEKDRTNLEFTAKLIQKMNDLQ